MLHSSGEQNAGRRSGYFCGMFSQFAFSYCASETFAVDLRKSNRFSKRANENNRRGSTAVGKATVLSPPLRTCPVGPAKFALCNGYVRRGGG
jgi:hypothetical protein